MSRLKKTFIIKEAAGEQAQDADEASGLLQEAINDAEGHAEALAGYLDAMDIGEDEGLDELEEAQDALDDVRKALEHAQSAMEKLQSALDNFDPPSQAPGGYDKNKTPGIDKMLAGDPPKKKSGPFDAGQD